MREMSVAELLLRNIAKFAAISGVVGVLLWLTWIMLDIKHLQSGFTLP